MACAVTIGCVWCAVNTWHRLQTGCCPSAVMTMTMTPGLGRWCVVASWLRCFVSGGVRALWASVASLQPGMPSLLASEARVAFLPLHHCCHCRDFDAQKTLEAARALRACVCVCVRACVCALGVCQGTHTSGLYSCALASLNLPLLVFVLEPARCFVVVVCWILVRKWWRWIVATVKNVRCPQMPAESSEMRTFLNSQQPLH